MLKGSVPEREPAKSPLAYCVAGGSPKGGGRTGCSPVPCGGAASLNDRTDGVNGEAAGTSGQAGGTSGQAGARCGSLCSEGMVPPEIMPGFGMPGMISCTPGGTAAKPENAPRNCSPVGSVGGSCIGRSVCGKSGPDPGSTELATREG